MAKHVGVRQKQSWSCRKPACAGKIKCEGTNKRSILSLHVCYRRKQSVDSVSNLQSPAKSMASAIGNRKFLCEGSRPDNSKNKSKRTGSKISQSNHFCAAKCKNWKLEKFVDWFCCSDVEPYRFQFSHNLSGRPQKDACVGWLLKPIGRKEMSNISWQAILKTLPKKGRMQSARER